MKLNLIPIFSAAVLSVVSIDCLFAADPLPAAMSGQWSGTSGGGAPLIFDVSIVVTKQSADGSVEGTVTRWGNGCGAINEPFKGTFDGASLKFTSMSHANVNSRRANATCGEDEYSVTRSPDGKSFQGKFGDVGAARFDLMLKPSQ
jgi:hypothetical protein